MIPCTRLKLYGPKNSIATLVLEPWALKTWRVTKHLAHVKPGNFENRICQGNSKNLGILVIPSFKIYAPPTLHHHHTVHNLKLLTLNPRKLKVAAGLSFFFLVPKFCRSKGVQRRLFVGLERGILLVQRRWTWDDCFWFEGVLMGVSTLNVGYSIATVLFTLLLFVWHATRVMLSHLDSISICICFCSNLFLFSMSGHK